jgi:hypothetical protein
MYCGAALGKELVAAAAQSAARAAALPAPPSQRQLVVLAAGAATREVLAGALGLSLFEADQRRRRGGYQLHRIADAPDATREAERLRAAGVAALLVPEAEARVALQPQLALGGRWEGQALRLRCDAGPDQVLAPESLLLVVKGPITRALEPEDKRIRTGGRLLSFAPVRVFAPGEGQRIHLHRVDEVRPLELDPEAFDFGSAPLAGSSALQLKEWLEALAAGVAVDDSFRHVTPALGPAEEAVDGPARALQRLRLRADDAAPEFDNLAQFRFFSGWRGAVERRAAH